MDEREEALDKREKDLLKRERLVEEQQQSVFNLHERLVDAFSPEVHPDRRAGILGQPSPPRDLQSLNSPSGPRDLRPPMARLETYNAPAQMSAQGPYHMSTDSTRHSAHPYNYPYHDPYYHLHRNPYSSTYQRSRWTAHYHSLQEDMLPGNELSNYPATSNFADPVQSRSQNIATRRVLETFQGQHQASFSTNDLGTRVSPRRYHGDAIQHTHYYNSDRGQGLVINQQPPQSAGQGDQRDFPASDPDPVKPSIYRERFGAEGWNSLPRAARSRRRQRHWREQNQDQPLSVQQDTLSRPPVGRGTGEERARATEASQGVPSLDDNTVKREEELELEDAEFKIEEDANTQDEGAETDSEDGVIDGAMEVAVAEVKGLRRPRSHIQPRVFASRQPSTLRSHSLRKPGLPRAPGPAIAKTKRSHGDAQSGNYLSRRDRKRRRRTLQAQHDRKQQPDKEARVSQTQRKGQETDGEEGEPLEADVATTASDADANM